MRIVPGFRTELEQMQNMFTSLPVNGFPHGPALVTVFTNGIPSTAKYVVVEKCDR